jgi:hypothetical protein
VFTTLEGVATKLFSYFLNKKRMLRQLDCIVINKKRMLRQLDCIVINKCYTILKSNN